jgi:hypothetical protein
MLVLALYNFPFEKKNYYHYHFGTMIYKQVKTQSNVDMQILSCPFLNLKKRIAFRNFNQINFFYYAN